MKRGALLVAALLACAVVHAASWRVTLLVPANDERLSRTRLERGALGHPGGPVADALKIAVNEGQAELPDGSKLTLDVIEAITIDAILNCSTRLTMPWRAAIQAKSVYAVHT